MSDDAHQLAAEVKAQARALGFDACGLAPAAPSARRAYWEAWLAAGRHGAMDYLARRLDERLDAQQILPGAATAICVALNYHRPLAPPPDDQPRGRIARYALGDDYHEQVKPRLYDLADWLRERVPGTRTKCGVDTAPIPERELAARAGVGWVGKHTLVIRPGVGSWLLLGTVLTTLALPPDAPTRDACGTCTRCLDACPTGAITAPYELDASRCISYLTIEHAGEIAPELQRKMGDWLFGCDVCQDVCPHNRRAPTSAAAWTTPRVPSGTAPLREVLEWTDDEYHAFTRRAPTRRVKLPVWKRNARIALDNLVPSPGTPGEG